MRPPSLSSMKVELQPCCQPQMPTVMMPGARWQMSTAGVHFKMPHACSFHMGAPCRAPEGFQRPVCFFSQYAQSFGMKCKVIGQCFTFLSVGHSSKGHPPPVSQSAANKAGESSVHTRGTWHLPLTPPCRHVSWASISRLLTLSAKEHLALCRQQSTLVALQNIL